MIQPATWRYRSLPLVAAMAMTVAAVAAPRPAATSAGRPQPEGAAAAPAPDLEPLRPLEFSGILGKKIFGPDNKELGLLVEFLSMRLAGRAPL
jgi:hypothetical protein